MGINFTLCCDYVQQMSFMSLSSLHNLQPLFAAPQIPNIRVHEYYSIFIFPSSKFTHDLILGITFFKTDYSSLFIIIHHYSHYLHILILQTMENTIETLIKKYPSLTFFDIREAVSPEELEIIGPELHMELKNMSQASKSIYKNIRRFALTTELKIKEGRQLYKTLRQSPNVESIILNNSKLKSIQALQYKYLDRLQELQLTNNQIRSLSPLKRLKSPELLELDLSSNAIENIRSLNEVTWPKLRQLNLSHNSILSIQGLPLFNFTSIKTLDLSDNYLTQARCLRKSLTPQLRHLKTLNLSNNELLDLSWLSECAFHKLQTLNLRNNKYPSFLVIQKLTMTSSQAQHQRLLVSHYQILVSTIGKRSSYCLGYRKLSKHKLSAKIEPAQARKDRQLIQKSRKLILI